MWRKGMGGMEGEVWMGWDVNKRKEGGIDLEKET
jgi:hypothetical protein